MEREYLRRKTQLVDYFDADDSENESEGRLEISDNQVDPLDAFMQEIDAQVTQQSTASLQQVEQKPQVLTFEDNDADIYLENYVMNTKIHRMPLEDSDEEVYATAKQMDSAVDNGEEFDKKVMEVLTPIDHSTIQYEPFRKTFYTLHNETAALDEHQVAQIRAELNVKVHGTHVPAPVRSFMHLGFDRKMLQMLMKLGLEAPTAIQSQAFPVALSGRDLIGIAKTGSGKTLAFTLPMVRHVMDQRELERGEGPIAVVLAPTRELAHQTYVQAKKFLAVYGASCAAVYGGAGKWEQVQALKKGVEVVVATPGRLIEMIRKKTAPMNRVTFVVLDEADRMFEMGFEPQLRSVMGQVRPDRQTLMFSATFRRRIESLALDVLTNPVKLTIGQVGQANEDIRQIAVVLPGHGAKWPWLMAHIRNLVDEGRLLIFAGSKAGCEELAKNLATAFPAASALCLHGDKTQQERAQALAKFKQGECRVLVATDVAARGLDVKDVKNVVNFDVAKNIDTHVHRIGRTGRMGLEGFELGTAYTLVTRNEAQFAAQLVYNMDVSGQPISLELLALAKRDARFRRGRAATGSVKGIEDRQCVPLNHQEQESHDRNKDHDFDAEDAAELERWSDSRQKSKFDQRKGLGFAGVGSVKAAGGKSVRMRGFVKASASATSLSTAFRSGFVKSTLKSDALEQPPPPDVSFVSSRTTPPAPASVSLALTSQMNSIGEPQLQQRTQVVDSATVLSNNIPPISSPLQPATAVSTSDDGTNAPHVVAALASGLQHEALPHRDPDSSQRASGSQSTSRGQRNRRSPYRSFSCSRSRSRSTSQHSRRSNSPDSQHRRRRRSRRSNSSDRSRGRSPCRSRSRGKSRKRDQKRSPRRSVSRSRSTERRRR
ncbi:unnamed protein product [Peronospora belbahrii]|uniref:RNA helicase n=1 Tax=Peronospora belbahrii TaxID=622444 RepID=A0AAU9LFT7_9STRA|nr:unnamed protein product [Peronospora belbahrii]